MTQFSAPLGGLGKIGSLQDLLSIPNSSSPLWIEGCPANISATQVSSSPSRAALAGQRGVHRLPALQGLLPNFQPTALNPSLVVLLMPFSPPSSSKVFRRPRLSICLFLPTPGARQHTPKAPAAVPPHAAGRAAALQATVPLQICQQSSFPASFSFSVTQVFCLASSHLSSLPYSEPHASLQTFPFLFCPVSLPQKSSPASTRPTSPP